MRVSPLRQRMIDDMTARHFGEKTQKDYIRCVKNLAAFIGRAPETATAEDLRPYRLHLIQSPLGAASVNSTMTALRFFFSITLNRYDLLKPLFRVEQPRKLPTVLTQDEVTRLLDAAPGAKYKERPPSETHYESCRSKYPNLGQVMLQERMSEF